MYNLESRCKVIIPNSRWKSLFWKSFGYEFLHERNLKKIKIVICIFFSRKFDRENFRYDCSRGHFNPQKLFSIWYKTLFSFPRKGCFYVWSGSRTTKTIGIKSQREFDGLSRPSSFPISPGESRVLEQSIFIFSDSEITF